MCIYIMCGYKCDAPLLLHFSANFGEMMAELFLPLDMPEPPKESFFKGLFGGGVRSLDREELCKDTSAKCTKQKTKNMCRHRDIRVSVGEASGKANKTVAKHIPGSMQDMNAKVQSSTSEISRAHKMAVERGEKLNQLEEKAEKMRYEAEEFSKNAHELMLKYKEKKWYQL